MDEQRGFLEAVRESPGEDLHRLAWADWLDDEGRHGRAEFLRACVHAARLEVTDPHRVSLEDEAARLLDAEERRWLGPLPEIALNWQWRAGCVERVTVRAAALLERGDELLAAAPVREMRVLGTGVELARLAAWPGLARIDTLDLGVRPPPGEPPLTGFSLRDIALDGLLSSPHLAGVRSLRLSGHDFSNPLVGWLIERGWMRRLRSLDLSGCSSFGNGAARMLAAADAPALESLDLRKTNLNPPGAGPVVAAPRWPHLRRLVLPFSLPPEELERMGRPERLAVEAGAVASWQISGVMAGPPPEHLNLRASGLSASSLAHIAGWQGLAGVRLLDLDENRLTDTAVKVLAASPHLRVLEHLGLDGNRIGGPGLGTLLHAPAFRGLTALGLGQNFVGGHGASLLASGGLPRLRRLSLANVNLDGDALASLAGSALLRRLAWLRFDGNPFGAHGLERLLKGGPLRVRELHVDACDLNGRAAGLLGDRDFFPHLRFVSARGGHFSGAECARLRKHFGVGWLGGDG